MTVAASQLHARWLRLLSPIVVILVVVLGSQLSIPPPAAAAPSACDIASTIPVVGTVCDIGETAIDIGTAVIENGGVAPAIADAAAQGGSDAISSFVRSLLNGTMEVLLWSMAWWTELPSPNLANFTALQTARDYTFELQLLLLTAGVMLTALRFAFTRKPAVVQEIEGTFRSLSNVVFASWMYAALIVALTKAGDAWSVWVIGAVTDQSADQAIQNMIDVDALGYLGLAPAFFVGIVGFIGALLQLVLLVVRQAFLIVVAAMVPIAGAAAAAGSIGHQTFQRLMSWSIAFVLFKPVGALVYVVAFGAFGAELQGSDAEKAQQVVLGLVLLALAGFVLPVLMRAVTPAIASMGAGGSGAAGLAMAASAGAAVAGVGMMAAGGGAGAGMGGAAGARGVGGGGGSSGVMASAGPSPDSGGGSTGARSGAGSSAPTKPPFDAQAPASRGTGPSSSTTTDSGGGSGSGGSGWSSAAGAVSAVGSAAESESPPAPQPRRHVGEIPQ